MDFDDALKHAAAASELLSRAEQAAADRAWAAVRQHADEIEIVFDQLRGCYRDADTTARPLITSLVMPLKARYENVLAAAPPLKSVSDGDGTPDPEENIPPED